ncbi:PREDICTED: stress response protein NST1-like [Camelina sativa]|uniref:Stress response protein NST1-like n=1 Tax=Camelina sativa TaxID=90675 RepID=A0ABM1RC32_CAMSA|nr:PREDICTED: stress response protein NST1-like [Camelina sativa]
MFELLFSRRWRTASTCEQLLQQLQSRLKLLISKKHALSRDLRSDIVIFIRFNDFINALRRTEQLVLVKNSVVVYELLLRFTKFIIHHIPYIAKHRKLSNDKINEAVSSLVFASASCGQELRELVSIKELFSQRYGQSFVTSALQLCPGNLVNLQMKENLSIPSDTEGAKTLLDEIAKQYLKASRHKYTHEISKQVDKKEEKKVMDSDLNWFSDKQSPHKVYKFCLKDYEEEIRKEDKLSEDDYIEEAQVGKDQRVLRSRESNEEERRAPSSSLLDEIAMEFSHRLEAFKFEYTPNKQQSPDGAYKFSLTDFEEEIRKEERSMEDDYIKEAQVGKDQRVFRFKERSEENRRSSSSSSLSSIKELCDMESITYYKTQKRTHQRRRRSSKKEGQEDRQKAVTNQHVHHPDYDQMKNKIKAVKAKEEEELQKLVQPKLPDEDQMVNQIKAVKAKEEEQGRLATRYVHPKLPDYDQLVAYFTDLKKQHCMSC